MNLTRDSIPQTPATLEFRGVSVRFNGRSALEDIHLQVPHGSRVAVVGPNGAGKSTLFRVLVGLQPVSSGSVYIHGAPLGHHLECVAYVPQREEVDWKFPVTVGDVVMMGRYGRLGLLRQPAPIDKAVVENAMRQLDIQHLAPRPIHQLSGGQQQRVFLARAIAQQPHILLMDEPFNGVDAPTQEATLRLLEDMKHQDVTMMVSTHDLNLAREYFDLVILLNHELIAFGAPADVFTTGNISRAYHSQVVMLDDALLVDHCCDGDHEPQEVRE